MPVSSIRSPLQPFTSMNSSLSVTIPPPVWKSAFTINASDSADSEDHARDKCEHLGDRTMGDVSAYFSKSVPLHSMCFHRNHPLSNSTVNVSGDPGWASREIYTTGGIQVTMVTS